MSVQELAPHQEVEIEVPDISIVSPAVATAVESEKTTRTDRFPDDIIYRTGLQDYVAGRRETPEAQYYVNYWAARR